MKIYITEYQINAVTITERKQWEKRTKKTKKKKKQKKNDIKQKKRHIVCMYKTVMRETYTNM